MPSFLNMPAGLLAAAVAAPLLLLLYFLRLRRREHVVSSTFLWRKAVQDLQVNAPFQRLRKNLLLLVQLLIILLLVLVLSRPVISGKFKAGKMSVILIDRSASMNTRDMEGGRTRLEAAKEKAEELVDTLEEDGAAMVIAFDDAPESIQSFVSDRARLKTAIASITPTDRRSRLGKAYELAEAQALGVNPDRAAGGEGPKPDIFLFSDGRIADATALSLQRANLTYMKIGSDAPHNIGVVSLSAKRNYLNPVQVQVFARVLNFGPQPVEDVGVSLSIDGQSQNIAQKLLLAPESWDADKRTKWEKDTGKHLRDSVDFSLDLAASAVVKVEHDQKKGDQLSSDDSAQVIVPPPRSLSVLLVTNGNFFMSRALESMSLKNPGMMSPDEYEAADRLKLTQDYDVVIFDRHDPKSLPPSGNFLYLRCLPPGNMVRAEMKDGARVSASDVGCVAFEHTHPTMQDIASLSRLYVKEALVLDPGPGDQVIVDGTRGPLVLLHREDRSQHLLVPFDPAESNWPIRPTFPVFINNTIRFLALGSTLDQRQAISPDQIVKIPRLNLQKAGDLKSFKIVGPEGERVFNVPETGEVALPSFNHVGLYTTEPAIPQFERIAVNLLDENESNVVPVERPTADKGMVVAAEASATRRELWRYLAWAALPLCLLEWWIYARRVHL